MLTLLKTFLEVLLKVDRLRAMISLALAAAISILLEIQYGIAIWKTIIVTWPFVWSILELTDKYLYHGVIEQAQFRIKMKHEIKKLTYEEFVVVGQTFCNQILPDNLRGLQSVLNKGIPESVSKD